MNAKIAAATTSSTEFSQMPGAPQRTASTPLSGNLDQVSEFYNTGLKQAVELGQAALDTAFLMSSCAIDMYKNAFCFSPAFTNFFEMVSQVLSSCTELQKESLDIWTTQGKAMRMPGFGAQPYTAATDVLERSMDIAMGAWTAQVDFFKEVASVASGHEPMQATGRKVMRQESEELEEAAS